MPLLVVSPFAKRNFVDHTLTDQTSVLRFVEDNWLERRAHSARRIVRHHRRLARNMFDFDRPFEEPPRRLILNETTGAVVSVSHDRDDDDRDDRR